MGFYCRSACADQPEMEVVRGEREKDRSGSSTDWITLGQVASALPSLSFLICKTELIIPVLLSGQGCGRKGESTLYNYNYGRPGRWAAGLWVGGYYLQLHADPRADALTPTRRPPHAPDLLLP